MIDVKHVTLERLNKLERWRLPKHWTTVKLCRELVSEGKAREIACDNPFMVEFESVKDDRN